MPTKSILIYSALLIVSILTFFQFLPLSFSSNPISPFISSFTPTSTPTPIPSLVTLGLMGDLGLGRMITQTARNKNDFSWSFSGLSSWLRQNDLNLANLESPIIENCPTLSLSTFTFCGDTRFLPQLQYHKFFFNLSNNHILNFGQDGLVQTKNYLREYSLPFVYSHQEATEFNLQTVNNISFGFIGFDLTGTHSFDPEHIKTLVVKYDSQVDWLIVSLHWGAEYLSRPEPWRLDLAHQLIDRGADIIHGHHPHVWQTPEVYQNRPIFYSFGNFIFDQNWSYNTSHSNIVRLVLSKDKIISQETFPIEIRQNSRPFILN